MLRKSLFFTGNSFSLWLFFSFWSWLGSLVLLQGWAEDKWGSTHRSWPGIEFPYCWLSSSSSQQKGRGRADLPVVLHSFFVWNQGGGCCCHHSSRECSLGLDQSVFLGLDVGIFDLQSIRYEFLLTLLTRMAHYVWHCQHFCSWLPLGHHFMTGSRLATKALIGHLPEAVHGTCWTCPLSFSLLLSASIGSPHHLPLIITCSVHTCNNGPVEMVMLIPLC